MSSSLWRKLGFALRQVASLETLGCAIAFCVPDILIYAFIATPNDRLLWNAGTLSPEIAHWLTISPLVAVPAVAFLLSRLNRRCFARPFPVGLATSVLRLIKANILSGCTLLVLTAVPTALAIVLLRQTGFDSRLAMAAVIYAAAAAAAVLIFLHVFYYHEMVYQGRAGFHRVRSLLRGHRLQLLLAMLLLAGAVFAVVIALGALWYGLFPEWRWLLPALLQGPLLLPGFALISSYYFDALAAEAAATGKPVSRPGT
ncbi:hypothetical protein [Zavarzinia sp.]|uniref:hypothetical protein n=1 Tax=Zavarzinia sp. TaxID=2027920 RepID=UPI00356570F8